MLLGKCCKDLAERLVARRTCTEVTASAAFLRTRLLLFVVAEGYRILQDVNDFNSRLLACSWHNHNACTS